MPRPRDARSKAGGPHARQLLSTKSGAVSATASVPAAPAQCQQRHSPLETGLRRVLLGTTSIVALGLALATTTPSRAAIDNWIGTSNDWFTGTNWSLSAFPTPADIAIIDTVTPNATVVGAPGAQADQLIVGNSNTGTLTIQSGGAVSNTGGEIGLRRLDRHRDGDRRRLVLDQFRQSHCRRIRRRHADDQDGGACANLRLHRPQSGSTARSPSPAPARPGSTCGLVVGNSGTGTLRIGRWRRSPADGKIGNNSGSNGRATVTGAGSTWTNIANSASATPAPAADDQPAAASPTLPAPSAAIRLDRQATVTGAGSTWTNSAAFTSDVIVGCPGAGTLRIQKAARCVSDASGNRQRSRLDRHGHGGPARARPGPIPSVSSSAIRHRHADDQATAARSATPRGYIGRQFRLDRHRHRPPAPARPGPISTPPRSPAISKSANLGTGTLTIQ